jgi:DNA-binding transcriptional MerR regulator
MEEIEKQYRTIGEIARMFNVKPSVLRHWEKEFDMIKPFKNKKGSRFYTQKDIEILKTIYYLTRTKGYTLQGAKEAIRNNFMKEASNAQVVSLLQNIRDSLLKIKELI